ncbi:HAMP domain-containing sensor histidine kinase [Nocardia sp. 348MFTsu5.1]|uniref:sensor histidine kinase n=1 Tax=Nocardia sp. 348MFTsu5.1 TaxID=1172185 RepID=UPI0012DEE086|nr:HAMP domain-containing sensor histidine kinase [Nocardia sp. 348MFTsu5.1]
MIGMVVGIGLLLGVPLMFTAWWWVDDTAHQDLDNRLDRISSELLRQEGSDGTVSGNLDRDKFRLLVPDEGLLTMNFPVSTPIGLEQREVGIGTDFDDQPVSESLALGEAGTLTLSIPQAQVRSRQWGAVGIVSLAVTISVIAGVVVAAVTAGRLADPLEEVAERATRMAHGDFGTAGRIYDIEELDRMSSALDAANSEITTRLEREGRIVGEVSHQLRSRLTAIRLRLDELSIHPDTAVVDEAEAALGQVERLTKDLDELISAARGEQVAMLDPVAIPEQVARVVNDFHQAFEVQGRQLTVQMAGQAAARVTPTRLREALAVLVDNALQHGKGDVVVDTRELPGSGMIRISVSDQGPGVTDESAPHVFQRGYSEGGSSGVGLSLARALIEADGGRLDLLHRRPPTFAIVVPRYDIDDDGADPVETNQAEPR